MNIRLKFLFLFLTAAINQNIFANTKVAVYVDKEIEMYILKDTIKQVRPNIKRYWNEVRYKEDVESEGRIVFKKGQYTKDLYESNCKEETYKNLVRIVYHENNKVEDSITRTKDEIEIKYIVPDTTGEKIQNYVCKN